MQVAPCAFAFVLLLALVLLTLYFRNGSKLGRGGLSVLAILAFGAFMLFIGDIGFTGKASIQVVKCHTAAQAFTAKPAC